MQSKPYLQHLYRAAAIGCMLYALTLIADTARAATMTTPATLCSLLDDHSVMAVTR